MKNKEKYFDEIIQASIKNSYCDFVKKHMISNKKLCSGKECGKCKNYFITWLEQEYIEEPKLSHDEYVILKNINKTFKWITRDECDCFLIVHEDKPEKKCDYWVFRLGKSHELIFDHLFQFIKWEDEEPYNIQELLEEYESYHSDN